MPALPLSAGGPPWLSSRLDINRHCSDNPGKAKNKGQKLSLLPDCPRGQLSLKTSC